MVALHRYWKDFDASAASSLSQATEPQLQHLARQSRSLQDQLAGLSGPGSANAAGVDEDFNTNLEPAHHIPGAHPVPPGSVPAGAAASLPASLLRGGEGGSNGGPPPRAALEEGTPRRLRGARSPALSSAPTSSSRRTANGGGGGRHGTLPGIESSPNQIIRDSDIEQLSALPRRRQIRALERMAQERLGHLRLHESAAALSGGSAAPASRDDRPSELHALDVLDEGWA